MAGAAGLRTYSALLARAGFENIHIEPKEESRAVISQWLPGSGAEDFVVSANITARKPGIASKNDLIVNVPKDHRLAKS